MSGVAGRVIDDVEGLAAALGSAIGAGSAGAEVRSHRFSPGGVSLVASGGALRVVAHTWPELGALTLDVHSASEDPAIVVGRCLTALLGSTSAFRVSAAPPPESDPVR